MLHLMLHLTRRGTTLVELVVALAIGVIVVGLVAQSVVGQRRAERTIAAAGQPASAADEAIDVVVSALARVPAGDSLWTRGDTALEWRATVGVALACVAAADSVVVPDAGDAAWWESFADSGDTAELLVAGGAWAPRDVVAVRARVAGGVCGAAQRTLRLRTPVAATALAAPPIVRVTRRTRFMLYRGGEGAWWLGERTCSAEPPVRCGAAQPIAGPLAAPLAGSRGGIRFAVDSSGSGITVTVTASAGRAVRTATVPLRP